MSELSEIDLVVLCGGLGTRLRPEVGDGQKVMAKVDDRPFLDIILSYAQQQGFKRAVLCTGYKAESVEDYYNDHKFKLDIEFSKEKEPLGTGGGVKNSRPLIQSDPFVVVNGDCFCPISYSELLDFHSDKAAVATITITKVEDNTDFGAVEVDEDNKVVSFREKAADSEPVFVNAGVYVFRKSVFDIMPQVEKFSMEKEFFPSLTRKGLFGYKIKEGFIDIGTPERFKQADQYIKEAGQ